jgi:hypothetical protein
MNFNDLEHVMKASGIGLHQRRKLINNMIQATAETEDDDSATSNLPRTSKMAQALVAAGFEAGAADRIVGALVRAGCAADDVGVGTMHASATNLSPMQKEALAVAQRFGIPVTAGRANPIAVDEALAKRNCSMQER